MRTAVVGILCFAAGVLAALWWSGPRGGARAERPARGERALVVAREKAARLERELEELRGSAAREEPAPETKEVEAGAVSRDRVAPFTDPASEPKLQDLDWVPAGAAITRLMPLFTEASEVVDGKRPWRPALLGEIFTHLGPLVTLAGDVEKAGVAWTHPSVQLNLLRSTLESAGRPLDERQAAAIRPVGLRFLDADERRRDGYGDGVPAVRKRLDKSRLLNGLYAAVEPLLHPEQRAVLWPPGVRGVVGMDIFSGAMVWDEHIEHLPHNGRERLRLSAVAGVMQHLALGEDLRGPVEHWVAEWAELFSDEFLAVKPHVAVRQNIDMDGTARVLAAADAQARLYETLLKQLPLSNEQREKLLEFDTVFVPLYIGD